MSIWFSIVLIILFVAIGNIGIVLQKQAADALPPMHGAWNTLRVFITSGRWMLGLALQTFGWGFFVWALKFTPVSLARTIMGSGFVVLAFFSVFFLNHRLKPMEWIAVILLVLGIVAVGFSEPAQAKTTTVIIPGRFYPAVGLSVLLLALIFLARWLKPGGLLQLGAFSLISGICIALGDIFTKALLFELGTKSHTQAWVIMLPGLLCFYIIGIFTLARAYQHGRAIAAIAIQDFAARLTAICIGIYAMGELLPADPTLRGLRLIGFAVVFIGALVLVRFSGAYLTQPNASS